MFTNSQVSKWPCTHNCTEVSYASFICKSLDIVGFKFQVSFANPYIPLGFKFGKYLGKNKYFKSRDCSHDKKSMTSPSLRFEFLENLGHSMDVPLSYVKTPKIGL